MLFLILCLFFPYTRPAESSGNRGISVYDARQLTATPTNHLPVIDVLDSQLILVKKPRASQGSVLCLKESDALSQASFRDLLQDNALNGLPLVLCRVSTTNAQEGTTYRHFYSNNILQYFYGNEFPKKAEGTGAKNPLNGLDPEEIELYLLKLGKDSNLEYTLLGEDREVIRRSLSGLRIIDVLNVSNGPSQVANQQFNDSAEALMNDGDLYIRSTALYHNGLRWVKQGKGNQDEEGYVKGLRRLIDCVKVGEQGNLYAQLLARYAIAIEYNNCDLFRAEDSRYLAIHDTFDKRLTKKGLVELLKGLSIQGYNLLLQDRAKTLLALIALEDAHNAGDLKTVTKELDNGRSQLKEVVVSQRSPTKTALACKILSRSGDIIPLPFSFPSSVETTSLAEDDMSNNESEYDSSFSDSDEEESVIRQMRRDYF